MAQSSALRTDPVTLEYNADSNYESAGITQFLTSSWGQLYWIVGSSVGAGSVEQDTGGGSSVNVGALNSQVGSGGYAYFGAMANGPDGALWLAGGYNNSAMDCSDEIFSLNSAGAVSTYPLGTCASMPSGIAAGSDGALWFTQVATGQIGRITTAGVITESASPCNLATNRLILQAPIISGSDGNLWFWCLAPTPTDSAIYKMTTAGQFTAYTLPSPYVFNAAGALGLTLGPDGNIWFPVLGPDSLASNFYLGSMSPSGTAHIYPLPAAGPNGLLNYLASVAAGPDGALWTSAYYNSASGTTPPSAFVRVTTSGQVSFLPILVDPSFANFQCQPVGAYAMGPGPNGTIAFATGDYAALQSCYLGRLRPGGTSLWPGTATATSSPAEARAIAKANFAAQVITRPVPQGDNPPAPCGPDHGCYISVAPQNPGVAAACNTALPGTCRFFPITPHLDLRYSNYQITGYTVGFGIGTDPNHQYGTCTGFGAYAGQTVQFTPAITPVLTKNVSLLTGQAEATITLVPVAPGLFNCAFEVHVATTTTSGFVTSYLPTSATVKFQSELVAPE